MIFQPVLVLGLIFVTVFINYCRSEMGALERIHEMHRCQIAPDHCPSPNITFFLYTRNRQEQPHQLNVGQMHTIDRAPFVRGKQIVVLIHGYTGDHDYSPNFEIRPAYFRDGEYNVISVDYGPLAREPCYLQAVKNLPVVARCTAQLLDTIIERQPFGIDDIHVIGFSLGGQTAGMISNFIKAGRLKRITGLDPAKPLFVLASSDHRLGKTDAEFVDVIHTDVLQRGILSPIGHADFYVNGGLEQPGCKLAINESKGSCNHVRAPQYYAESISSDDGFWGFHCREWVTWALGICRPSKSNEMAIMGKRTSNEARGVYFVYTNKEPPYAKGILPEFAVTGGDLPTTGGLENVTSDVINGASKM